MSKTLQIKNINGQNYAPVKSLVAWKDNPRDVEGEDFQRLLKQIELGEHSTLLITRDGEVLGGNTRLKAYREIGKEYAKVVIVDFHKDDDGAIRATVDGELAEREFDTYEQAKLEYALSHNDAIGMYNEKKLAKLLHVHALPMELYKVPVALQQIEDVAFEAGGGDMADRDRDEDTTDDKLDTFMNGSIKQIVLYFSNEQYEEVMPRIEALRAEVGLENNTELFLAMLDKMEKLNDE